MDNPKDPTQNHLLAALLKTTAVRLTPHLKLIPMSLGNILYENGSKLKYVYFPLTSLVSLRGILANGSSVEIAGVGNEGMVGISLFMGNDTTNNRAIVLTEGYGYRLNANILLRVFNRAGTEMQLLLRYTQALMMQISQTAVCNPRHSFEQQLCRWLLFAMDHVQGQELLVTHELIAITLGARRERVTETAGKLQKLGFIQYQRGHITVVDRSGLEEHACECYGVVKKEIARLLPDVSQLKSTQN